MEKEPEKLLNEFKEHLSSFIGLKLELLKLNAYERVAKIIAILSHSLILMLLAFFTVLFIFIALGFFLGELLHSVSLGFLLVAVIYIILFLIVFYDKKGVQTIIMNIVINAIQEKEEEDNDDGDEKYHTDKQAGIPPASGTSGKASESENPVTATDRSNDRTETPLSAGGAKGL